MASADQQVGKCLACDVVAGRVVPPGGVILDDGLWIVDHSTSPVLLPGFLIVKPKRHVESIADLTADEAAALGPLLRRVLAAVNGALGAERVYVTSFGEAVRHVHWYIVPRYAGMPAKGPEVIRMMFEERPWLASYAEGAAAAEKVRRALEPR
jgi:diadenosine tetraphosphate (Ap4A) HIT family hydrolase